ncbi:hypothetical protein IscW_ISCW008187, partial [Ixodes scapularis]
MTSAPFEDTLMKSSISFSSSIYFYSYKYFTPKQRSEMPRRRRLAPPSAPLGCFAGSRRHAAPRWSHRCLSSCSTCRSSEARLPQNTFYWPSSVCCVPRRRHSSSVRPVPGEHFPRNTSSRCLQFRTSRTSKSSWPMPKNFGRVCHATCCHLRETVNYQICAKEGEGGCKIIKKSKQNLL